MVIKNIASGSSGNVTFAGTETTRVLIDAGISKKRIVQGLGEEGLDLTDIDAILVTHEHIDHTKGLTTISKKFGVPIYATSKTWTAMDCLDIAIGCREFFNPNEELKIGDLKIFPFSIPHDAVDPCAFSIIGEDKKITIATDMGHITEEALHQMEESSLLLLEANYDKDTLNCGPYPYFLKKRIGGQLGHLSNDDASKAISYLCKKGVNNFVLGHLSKENNFPELAYQTVLNDLMQNNIDVEKYKLSVASRDRVDSVINL